MSDEPKIVIANNGGGVINVLIMGHNPIVISDPSQYNGARRGVASRR